MLFSWSRLKSLKEQFPLILAYKPLNQWGVICCFYFLMQGKNSGKILWQTLFFELINPGWDSMDSTGYSLPNEQHKSRLSVMLYLDCRPQHTLQSWYFGFSEFGHAHFNTFLVHIQNFSPKNDVQQRPMQYRILHWVRGSCGACSDPSAWRCLLPGPPVHT